MKISPARFTLRLWKCRAGVSPAGVNLPSAGGTPAIQCLKVCRLFLITLTATVALAQEEVPQKMTPIETMRPESLTIDAEEGKLENSTVIGTVDGALASARQMTIVSTFGDRQLVGYRTVVNVAGKNPYSFVMEDYPSLGGTSMVERGFPMPEGAKLAGFKYENGANDFLLKKSDGMTSILRILGTGAAPKKEVAGMRVGGPAMVIERGDGERTLSVPAYTDQPGLRMLMVNDARNAPVSKWVDGGKALRVEWNDQIDVFKVERDADGRANFVLERQRGDHQDEVISFGLPYTPPEGASGSLLAHWSFDKVKGDKVADVSGNGFDATMTGGVRLTSGVLGNGLDGVSAEGVREGELVVPTPEGVLPGKLEYGELQLPGEAFQQIQDKMTLTFWYAMPPFLSNAYHAYMGYWKEAGDQSPFTAKGLRLYPYIHWLKGHMITAEGLGNGRLFGMSGPEQPRDMWNHYAIVIDGKEASLYLNGDLKLQQTGKTTLEGVISATDIASVLKSTWARMDEIRLYNYPLSLDEIQAQFREDGQGRLMALSFDKENRGVVDEGAVSDSEGNSYKATNVEIVPREGGEGLALRFPEGGGKVLFPESITQGKKIDALTFAAWVKLPEGYNERAHLFKSGSHGHAGMFVGFHRGNLWGVASMNGFAGKVKPGEWTHVICSYGHNRIRTYINGEKVQDNDQAFPSNKGWEVGQFSLEHNAGLELDDVQLFGFALSDEQAGEVFAGKEVRRPEGFQGDGNKEKPVIEAQFVNQQQEGGQNLQN